MSDGTWQIILPSVICHWKIHLAEGQMEGAPLLPKLRGYFAEFLREVSLARLSLFDSPTCVGLRYGPLGKQLRTFLGRLSGDALRPEA